MMHTIVDPRLFKKIIFRSTLILCLIFLQMVGYAQIQAPPFIFKWLGQPNSIIVLDSLIGKSSTLALNAADYNKAPIRQYIQFPQTILTYKDSLTIELAIQKTATHFFNDLAYGNKPPSLEYRGAKFNLIAYNVPALIQTYMQINQLGALAKALSQSCIEVKKILDTLSVLQKVAVKNKTVINLLVKAANDYRWLNAVRSQHRMVLVNIPSAQLKVYDGPATTLQMKLIMGKATTPTKTLSSYIEQVTIHPYWTVPKSIIIGEMVPKIQKDIQYLSKNRLAVLNENYSTINPYQINWQTIDLENFPYTIRQATGCENALGILKLEFENPFAMYLHDTPEKQLFKNKYRFLSHGCMRMENPIAMGRLLLADNLKAIDSIDLTKCDLNLKPLFIPVTIKTPLVVWYSQVDFDSNNNLLFYKNVYNR